MVFTAIKKAKGTRIRKCRLFMSSVEYSCTFFQTYLCIQANSVDPDQTDCLHKLLLKSQADDKADDNCCDWQFKG